MQTNRKKPERYPWPDTFLYRLQENKTKVLYGSYQTNSTETGTLENQPLPAGYYVVEVAGASNHTNKQVLSVPGNNKPVEFEFSDYGVNPDYDISLCSLVYTEHNEYNKFRLGNPGINHNTDSIGQKSVAFGTWQSGPYAHTTDYFFYNSACTPYQLQFSFSSTQMEQLQAIADYDAAQNKSCYTLDIACVYEQKPEQSRILVLSAADIVNNAELVNNRYVLRVATLTFDTSSMTFNVSYPVS